MVEQIGQELDDFIQIWNKTFVDPDTGRNRPAGGTSFTDGDGISGVDYSELIAWAKGNSVSSDQNTIHDFVEYLDMLFSRMREHLINIDRGKKPGLAGLTYRDFTKKGQLVANRSRRYAAGDPTLKGQIVEILLCRLLIAAQLDLYSDDKTIAKEVQNAIIEEINVTQWRCLIDDDSFIKSRGIVHHLSKTLHQKGHVRLTRAWETIVRDHFGAPNGIPGAIPGSLTADIPANTPRTMPIPIHYPFAEAMAKFRKAEINQLNSWGKNQLKVRQQLCDIANEQNTDTISLNDYYRIYRENLVLHMADSELSRSNVDITRPSYVMNEIAGSNPKQWTVTLDPGLIRWRINQRTRALERDGNNI